MYTLHFDEKACILIKYIQSNLKILSIQKCSGIYFQSGEKAKLGGQHRISTHGEICFRFMLNQPKPDRNIKRNTISFQINRKMDNTIDFQYQKNFHFVPNQLEIGKYNQIVIPNEIPYSSKSIGKW